MIDIARLLAVPALDVPYRHGPHEAMLHALASGIGHDPMDADALRFAYDDPDPARPLLALPTLPLVLGWADLVRDPRRQDPRLGLAGDRVVVGQAGLTLHGPAGVDGEGIARTFFADAVDKGPGRGALVCVRRDVFDAQRTLVATIDTWLFVRGAGGFGGRREGGPERPTMPQRPPDAELEQPTPGHAALLYRLVLGDHNAAHADPAHAARGGFERPLLHGLATFSMAIHAAIKGCAGPLAQHARRLVGAQASTTAPVYPGDRLRTQAWRDGDTVYFRTLAAGRDAAVIDGGRLTLAPA